MPAVVYTIGMTEPRAHRFQVSCHVERPDPQGQRFTMPAWIRGSYLVRDFAKHVVRIRAMSDGEEVSYNRIDKSSLRCEPVDKALTLEYEVYAFDPSVRKAYLDGRRGFFNPGSLCYRPVGADDDGYRVELLAPTNSHTGNWRVYTTAHAENVDQRGWGRYLFDSYETLLDRPFELGDHRSVEFAAEGVPHALVLAGEGRSNDERLQADMAAICAEQRRLFGGEPRIERYLFLCNLTDSGYGGLEHVDSSVLTAARASLPRHQDTAARRDYRTFLGLVSHEYFHQWNVKRITARALADSDLSAPAYTCDLWAYEGVTSYYDDWFLLRAGIVDAPTYLDLLAMTATRALRMPGHTVQTLADSSFEAWTKYYQQDEDAPNSVVSYYTKGALVAVCLDLHLRLHSDINLDAVMVELWRRYGATGVPAPEGALEMVSQELSGLNLEAFFDSALRSTEPLPLPELLPAFAVKAEQRVMHGDSDQGGRSAGTAVCVDLGLRLQAGSARVAYTRHGGAAESAGLAVGDEIVAIGGLRFKPSDGWDQAGRLREDEPVEVHYFRDGVLIQTSLTPQAPVADTWVLTLADDNADADALARRHAWLGV